MKVNNTCVRIFWEGENSNFKKKEILAFNNHQSPYYLQTSSSYNNSNDLWQVCADSRIRYGEKYSMFSVVSRYPLFLAQISDALVLHLPPPFYRFSPQLFRKNVCKECFKPSGDHKNAPAKNNAVTETIAASESVSLSSPTFHTPSRLSHASVTVHQESVFVCECE